jgi:hypothetical protein
MGSRVAATPGPVRGPKRTSRGCGEFLLGVIGEGFFVGVDGVEAEAFEVPDGGAEAGDLCDGGGAGQAVGVAEGQVEARGWSRRRP